MGVRREMGGFALNAEAALTILYYTILYYPTALCAFLARDSEVSTFRFAAAQEKSGADLRGCLVL